MRDPVGTQAQITYANPNGKATKATLKAIQERDSYAFTSIYRGFDSNALPVEFKILDSGVGYIKVNSNYDDLNLILKLFKRALDTFKANELTSVIIDLRQNSGGSPLGFAGYFTKNEIPMGQLEYFSDKTGKFEPDAPRELIRPFVEQYQFDRIATLVGMACASACEIEAYGLSQVPGMIVMGETPSSGIEAEVSRGEFSLPDGISMQVPTGRFKLPDGSIFLEGQGVQLTQKVPDTVENLLSGQDFVLAAAEKAVLAPVTSGIAATGDPKVSSSADTQTAVQDSNATFLEAVAKEQYDNPTEVGKDYTYTISLKESKPLEWAFGWCASSAAVLKNNMDAIKITFTMEGKEMDPANLATIDYPSGDMQCRILAYQLTDWPAGEHHLKTEIAINKSINDGSADYPKGSFSYDYLVDVKPQ
jgi:C-terminal processing protease CtpA/Prc